ncbi:MAG: DUF3570 domain-containing protein [Candidatus Eisenbacteria bacterium]|uniref:DUF3570 domain-containing protein n=1 Tax=Eiseniibacteriota bacterium TaxID=2212470 RepID=A0A948RXX1_UNCEI|nr:DUF3570 domain-containing protein [Candidatus Eisenbacteria bacterium]MBU1950788.1 DUF3570 domain-containing protein [Candidatus Eisenbacteria bacterium]MBU2691588.1 DUF3570 domain-containing protein [Candidatus Eisenbacteria bacterium]
MRTGLAAATGLLLTAIPGPSRAGQVEGTTLVYTEPNRVTAVETAIEGSKELKSGGSLLLKFVYDALTGASASGATPADRVQTFTGPSGKNSYSIAPGDTPLDPTFRDERFAGSATWIHPLGRMSQANLGMNISSETDYLSLGISGVITRDLAMRNTTLAAGFSLSHDTVDPTGGIPTALTPLTGSSADENKGDDFQKDDDGDEGGGRSGGPAEAKDIADFLVGLTQVLDRATIARLNYTRGYSSGYLTDPYKILSLVQSPYEAEPGEPLQYLYENRPDRRTKQSLYGEVRRMIGSDVATASYRYYWDSWSIHSSTLDLHLSHRFGNRTEIEPHFRIYHQHQADFYNRYLVSGRTLPTFASADYRIGTFTAATYGVQAVHTLDSGLALRFGIEYYLQQGDSSPPDAFGSLVGPDLFPDVSAWMIRVGTSFPVEWW